MIEFRLVTDGGTFEFSSTHVSLGRDRRCAFLLPDASVMPFHAAIVADGDRLYLEKADFDALTFVNRAPIHRRVELYDGDLIDIGPWTLVLRSKQIARRESPFARKNVTPSDHAIVETIRLPTFDNPASPDETSGSIII